MTTYNLTCDGPGPHVPASGAIGTLERSTPPRAGEFRCTSVACAPAPQTPDQVNAGSLRDQLAAQIAPGSPARNAVAGNTTYIQGAKPGTAAAQASAAYDQAKALSQQNNVIIPTLLRTIRLLLGALDSGS